MAGNKIVQAKKRITGRALLSYLAVNLDILFPLTKKKALRNRLRIIPSLEDFLPASVYLSADRLERKGMVQKIPSPKGILVKITNKGKTQLLKYDLSAFKPPKQNWDGQWRLVFFDIAEIQRRKRDSLRRYLRNLGMEQMQESVFVSPYDVFDQVAYLREVLEIPHGVKFAVLTWIENQDELKQIFELK